ncbi:unnamed protein product [Schistosoma mattheei]|uniref:GATA-type domain-containing protein n=1 Tax=Schistosoma mattheei TaxID=31246 RepID=A0AA85BQP1_9TREM|nr:unnamed protein product [Schistosoma mattheei]
MEPPTKRQCFDDVLDLSRKSNHVTNGSEKLSSRNDDDVIMLSEDEDDRLLGSLCDEMEKENAPKQSLLSKSRAFLLKLENELRNEESALVLLQQLRANQRSHALQPKSTKVSSSVTNTVRNTQSPVNQVRPAVSQAVIRNVPSTTGGRATLSPAQNTTAVNPTNATAITKVTKGMAIHALEQQCSGKKAMLRKQLERTLDKVVLPKPAVGNGLSVVPFVPSTLTNEFTAMIGLEEIVTTIQNVFNTASSSRHGQTNVVNSASSSQLGMPNVSSRRQTTSNNVSVSSPVSLPIQQQGHVAGNVVQQLASRYQQLTKAAVAAVVGGGQSPVNHSVASNAATANLMMTAAANPMLAAAAAVSATNQQQQSVAQQQLTAAALAQQRLAAVAALNFQHQQPHHTQPSTGAVTPNSPIDHLAQFTQMQTLLMSSLLGNAAAATGAQATANTRQQQQQILQHALLQYTYLLQQQQAAAAAQAQQQQNQQVNAAALQQLMSGAAANPAACMTLLQNLWALNAASNGVKK